ncbi:Hsp20/alpha crystallin family protein [Sulfurovum sp.]|uniref:Hsp20/alpha crystallin family protein n=1 Tax=Sulfurovum sp. TaxID=1969726 RepID=UPI0025D90403|nr:Hsp20/alpha crystallin family protein [Sulfurovum sp.]
MFTKKLSLLMLPLVATFSLHASDPFNDPFFNDPFGDDIFKEMMQMQQNMDKMFERMNKRIQQRSSGLVSPLGTYKMAAQNQLADKGDHYELVTNIPQSKENHIDIKTENGVMSITAKIVQEQENKTANSVSQSRSVRMYQQSMTLPNNADEGAITTAYKNGKLVVSIAKKKGVKQLVAPKAEPKKVEEKKSQEKNEKKEDNTTIKKMTLHTDVHEMS